MGHGSRTYDVFITHAWRYHQDWNRLADLLNTVPSFRWRNFSVPWYDPALDPNTELGKRLVGTWLESQIMPANVVVFLDSVFAVRSARNWVATEVSIARHHKKPVLGLPAFGAMGVSGEVADLVDAVLPWDADVLVGTFVEITSRNEALQTGQDSIRRI